MQHSPAATHSGATATDDVVQTKSALGRRLLAQLLSMLMIAGVAVGVSSTMAEAAPAEVKLPYPTGSTYQITQGWSGGYSHDTNHSWYAVDLALPQGSVVTSAGAGTVKLAVGGCNGWVKQAGCNAGLGNYLVIEHEPGTCSQYAHLQRLDVKKGQRVRVGQAVALSGNSGNSDGAHIHFSVTSCNYIAKKFSFTEYRGELWDDDVNGLRLTSGRVAAKTTKKTKGYRGDDLGMRRGYTYGLNFDEDGDAEVRYSKGSASDEHFTGDFNGDGRTDIGRQTTDGTIRINTDNDKTDEIVFKYGRGTDTVLVGDWDADGSDDVGLRRANHYYLNFDEDGDSEVHYAKGSRHDKHFTGDFNGDGRTDIGRQTTKGAIAINTDNDKTDEIVFKYGRGTDTVLVGDWDGDGSDDLGMRRGHTYYLNFDEDGDSEVRYSKGTASDEHFTGDFNGDGRTDIGRQTADGTIRINTDNDKTDEIVFKYGRGTDTVLVGNWDND